MIKKIWLLGWLLMFASTVYADDRAVLAQVERSARDWLARIDAGDYQESWEQASKLLKSKTAQAEWVKSTMALRSSRGKVVARYIATAGAHEKPLRLAEMLQSGVTVLIHFRLV